VAPQVIRTLVEEGAKASHVTRMMTILNDLILEKLMDLLLKEMGPAPAPFCWLLMGSEGRREQTFKTDQDNALVYKPLHDEDGIVERAAALYFQVFARKAIDHLVKCGFPPCPGDIMASNDRWRQPFDAWRGHFEAWIAKPEPEEVMNAAIFFDFRSGYGNGEFARELRDHVARHAKREEVFLRYLAANCLETRPPLSFFKNFLVEKDGEHRNHLDIKRRGIVPFVDFARVMALKAGVKETNTLDRLDLLDKEEHIPHGLFNNMRDAFEFLLQLRLVHQLELVEQGAQPDNFIDPAGLSEVEKRTLKEAFAVIGQLQGFLRDMFRLNV
jgi:CBS domain-containing protein